MEPKPIAIEEVFKSRGRVLVLKILCKGELNISAICSESGIGNVSITRHLNALVALGVIQEKRFGRIKIYRLCIENTRVQNIKTLLDSWAS